MKRVRGIVSRRINKPVPADFGTDCTRRLVMHGGRRIEPAMGPMKIKWLVAGTCLPEGFVIGPGGAWRRWR